MKSPTPATAVPVWQFTWPMLVKVRTLMSVNVLTASRSTSLFWRVAEGVAAVDQVGPASAGVECRRRRWRWGAQEEVGEAVVVDVAGGGHGGAQLRGRGVAREEGQAIEGEAGGAGDRVGLVRVAERADVADALIGDQGQPVDVARVDRVRAEDQVGAGVGARARRWGSAR